MLTWSNSSYIATNVRNATIQMLFGNWMICDLCVRKCVECPVQQWNVLMEYLKHFNVFYNLVYLLECFWQWKWVEMWDNKRRRLCHCLQIILFYFGITTKTNQTCKMEVETHLSLSRYSIRIGPLPQIKIWCYNITSFGMIAYISSISYTIHFTIDSTSSVLCHIHRSLSPCTIHRILPYSMMAQIHPISWHKPLLSSFTVHIVWCIISSSRKKIGTIKSAEPFLMMSKFSRAHSSLLLCMLLFGLVVHLFRLFFSRLPQMDSQNIFHCSICSSQQTLIVLLLGECVLVCLCMPKWNDIFKLLSSQFRALSRTFSFMVII